MIVAENTPVCAAEEVWMRSDGDVSLKKCITAAEIIDTAEVPMGMSEAQTIEWLEEHTRDEMRTRGLLSAPILAWLFQAALTQIISMLVKHYVRNKGWQSKAAD